MEAFRGQISTDIWVIKITEFNSEVRCDLRGYLEAIMTSGATKMAIRGNMHMDTRVIEVTDFKSQVKFDFRGY